MAGFQRYTLTQNGQWFMMKSGSHKTDVIHALINGTFENNASLIETTCYQALDGTFLELTPFRDGNASQIEISKSTQYSRSVAHKDVWYRLTVQNASGATNIKINATGSYSVIVSNGVTVEQI